MKNRIIYAVIAGLAFTALGTVSQEAVAGDNTYFKMLSPLTAITQRRILSPCSTVETTISSPVVIERTTSISTVVLGTTCTPMMLEKTTVAKPHHFLSFGVWP